MDHSSLSLKIASELGLDPNCPEGVRLAFLLTYLLTKPRDFDKTGKFALDLSCATPEHAKIFQKMIEKKKHAITPAAWKSLLLSFDCDSSNDCDPSKEFFSSLEKLVEGLPQVEKLSEFLFYSLTPHLTENEDWVDYWPHGLLGPLTEDTKIFTDSLKKNGCIDPEFVKMLTEGLIRFY